MLETRTKPLTEDRAPLQRAEPVAREGRPGSAPSQPSQLPAGQAPRAVDTDRLTFSPEGLEALRREQAAEPDRDLARAAAGEEREAHAAEAREPGQLVRMAELEERRDLVRLRGQDLTVRGQQRVDPEGDPGSLAQSFDYEMGPDGRRYAVGTAGTEAAPDRQGHRAIGAEEARDTRGSTAPAARAYAGTLALGASPRTDFLA